MRQYVLSRRAHTDLLNIWNYIAERHFDAADRVRDEIIQAMVDLAAMPGKGHHRSDVRNSRLRFWSVYSYVIVYLPDTRPVEIVRIVHGNQNFKSLFK